MKTPDRSGWSQRTQRGMAGSARAGLEIRNETQAGSIDSPSAKPSRSATGARGSSQAAQQRPELVLDDPARQVLVGQSLAGRPAGVGRRLEGGQDVLVEEVGERPVADVVEQPGHPHRLDDEAFGRGRFAGRGQGGTEARIERARPQPGLVHDPEAVGEARMLGGREDPARALELADPAQALEPGGVEQVLLGDLLVGEPGERGFVGRKPLGQLDVAVDRVADQVDRRERMASHHP